MSQKKIIAKRISSLCTSRSTREYSRIKILTDPLYGGVREVLASRQQPLLDVGCGMGMLAFYLRESDIETPITGFDFDRRKIDEGKRMIAAGNYTDISLAQGDARTDLPEHQGDVTVLDILQFFDEADQNILLKAITQRVGPGGKLIIRSGLKMNNFRFFITWLGDVFARSTSWMKAGPSHYPTEESIRSILEEAGLSVEVRPFWGKTPFNNFLIVATRDSD